MSYLDSVESRYDLVFINSKIFVYIDIFLYTNNLHGINHFLKENSETVSAMYCLRKLLFNNYVMLFLESLQYFKTDQIVFLLSMLWN